MAEQVRLEMERAEKEKHRVEKEQEIHAEKVSKSAAMFKNTKITSC